MPSSGGGSIVNIAGLTPVEDPSYRYKMPLVFGKIEGSGNGIKTVIPNISDVGMSLHRSPAEVTKFFGCELGAQTTYVSDTTTSSTDRAVVNGAHNDAALQQLVHKYVELFVLCPTCGLPETRYKIKNESIWHRCVACGAKEMVDMTHKLTNFILAQDKKEKREAKAREKKAAKEKKKKDADDNGNGNGSGNDKQDGEVDKKKRDKKSKDKGKDNKKEKKKKGKSKKEKKSSTIGEEGSDGSGDLVDRANGLSLGDDAVDDAFAMNAAVAETRKYITEHPDATAKEIVEVVANQQMASALKSHAKIQIYIRSVLKPDDITIDFFKNNKLQQLSRVILEFTNGNIIIERHLIALAEWLCADKPKMFPVLLKNLYEGDLLQEVALLEWAAEGRSDYTLDMVDEERRAMLRAESEPLIGWLQEDSESDSSGDD